MKLRVVCLVVGFLLSVLSMAAQTTGSSPASAQVPPLGNSSSVSPDSAGADGGAAPALTGTGTKDYVPLWLSSTKLGNSKLFQTGGKVGIGTKTPAATLDVNGTVNAATSFNLGGNAFAFGSYANQNAFLGFAGNTTMTGGFNTASGAYALFSNTSGSYNTASGGSALYSNTTGGYNTANGYQALAHNTAGAFNDAFGYQALVSNTLGQENVALGYQAMYYNVGDGVGDGSYNTAVGYQALYANNNTSGLSLYALDNVAVGLQALVSNTTGSDNTAVGTFALGGNTTGGDLTCIGYECNASKDGLHNATAIGAHAVVGQSNTLVLGGTGKWAVKVGIGTTKPTNILTIARGSGHPVSDGWETFSSRRWKINIQTLRGALGKVERLRGVSYDEKENGKRQVGVIAEEVGAVVPEVVTWDENGKDAQSVDYSRLTALLIEATKEQQREIQQQRAVMDAQAAAIRDLRSELRATRQTLEKVKEQVDATQPALVAAR